MPKHKEECYMWKELAVGRLFTPWSDGQLHEFAMDWQFITPESAHSALIDIADPEEEGWVLVKVTMEVV
jgi:hypothetical protein